jgi:hypothetical protein
MLEIVKLHGDDDMRLLAVGKNIQKRSQRAAQQATMEVARRAEPDNFLSGGKSCVGTLICISSQNLSIFP